MSLKQEKVLQELPKVGYNLSAAMRRAGYTEAGSKAGTNYRGLRRLTREKGLFSDPEETKKEIEKAKRKFLKDNDNSNLSRMIELQAKIAVPELRRQDIRQENINPEKIILVDNRQSQVKSPTENEPNQIQDT